MFLCWQSVFYSAYSLVTIQTNKNKQKETKTCNKDFQGQLEVKIMETTSRISLILYMPWKKRNALSYFWNKSGDPRTSLGRGFQRVRTRKSKTMPILFSWFMTRGIEFRLLNKFANKLINVYLVELYILSVHKSNYLLFVLVYVSYSNKRDCIFCKLFSKCGLWQNS